MVVLNAHTKYLCQTLKSVKVAVRGNGTKAHTTYCEITVTDGKATFAVPGAVFSMECITKGTCKTTVPFLHFYNIIRDNKKSETEIIIGNGTMQIGLVTIEAKTTFFETDKILRTISLPINYTDEDLIHLREEGYTKEELDFNNLSVKIQQAEEKQKKKLEEEAAKQMSQIKYSEPSSGSSSQNDPVFVFNPFNNHHLDVCCGNDELRPVMQYIYFIDGIAYAFNANIFIAVSLADLYVDAEFIAHLEGCKMHKSSFQMLKKYKSFYLQKPATILLNERTIQIHLDKIDEKNADEKFIQLFQRISNWINEKSTHNIPVKNIRVNVSSFNKICKVFNSNIMARLTFLQNTNRVYVEFDNYQNSYCWLSGMFDY